MASSSHSVVAVTPHLDEELTTLLPANKDTDGLAKKALVGQVLTNKTLNRNAVRDIIYKGWNTY